MRPIALLVVLAVVGGGLVACETPPPQNKFPEITFRHIPPIRLDVREIAVEQAYEPSYTAPNVEHLFPIKPGDAAVRWAEDRLAAAGPMRRARYIVREASVTETPLKTEKGLSGLVTVDQTERYDAKLVVELQIIGDDGRTEGTATVQAVRSRSVPEDITLSEREKVWFKMTEDLIQELDKQLEETIKTVFFKYLII